MSSWRSCRMYPSLVVVFFALGSVTIGQIQTNPYPEWVDEIQTGSKSDDSITNNDTYGIERGKRLLLKDPKYHWPKGIVPFQYTRRLVENYPVELKEIAMAMAVYEHYTPIRFIPWTKTLHTDLDLGHQGFAIFTAYAEIYSCSSIIGNERNKKGQPINCCKRRTCVHEIGHLLGFHHEHQHQDRDMWIRLNWNAIGGRSRQFMKLPPELFKYRKYDISSYMHYPPESPFGQSTFTYIWPDVPSIQRHFYMFKELCAIYKCHEFHQCKNHTLKCRNGGYVSVVNNGCSCICPPGLDPTYNCFRPIQGVSSLLRMPRGRYGVLKKGDDCPEGPFQEKSMANNSHNFQACIRTTKDCSKNSNCGWPHGTYCFIKNGKCPSGRGITKGQLTSLRSSDVRIRFCCFENGFPEEPAQFPNTLPFSLFIKHNKECQQVIGMRAEKRSIEFLNTKLRDGPYSEGNSDKRELFVCDYTPVDMNCGSIYYLNRAHPKITIQSDRLNASSRDCTWLIKGPKKSTLILNFDQFDIKSDKTNCIDTVTVKHSRIGYVGIEYCGKQVKHSIRSIYKQLMVRFRTGDNSNSHFKATITLKTDNDMCYDPQDRGLSYGGNVSYTRRFVPCIPWKDATPCHHNTFQGGLPVNTLEGNYCRNPDNSFRPWCYTNVKECVRDFCDVCHFEKAYDHADDCDQFDCTKDHNEVVGKCAATCQAAKTDMTSKVSHIRCPKPGQMKDGVSQSSKSFYNVGEKVKYKCTLKNSDRVIERICLSTGQWSVANTACTECPLGFGPYKGHCYQYVNTKVTYDQAKNACIKLGAYLATVKSEDENDHVHSIRLRSANYLWLGGYYNKSKKAFVWEDGSPIDWFHFSLAPPNPITKSSDMHFTLAYWKSWERFDKKERHHFVCKMDSLDIPACEDYLDDCRGMLKNKENINCYTAPNMANLSPNLRNLCRYTCGLCLRGCGSEIKLNENNKRVTFEAGTMNTECTWAINAPPTKGVLVFHFDEFDVETDQNDKCVDKMEVRISNLGKLGSTYCGKELKESIVTTNNKILIMYQSHANSKSHFKATVKWIPESEWCYKSHDKGFSYGGNVSYAQNFRSCVSWDLATKCYHHPYNSKDLLKNLEKNYCRNPDNSPEPWCYIDVDMCQREPCDVCHWAQPFDRSQLCKKKDKTFCSDIPKIAVESCAATCHDEIIQHAKKVSEVTCDPPKPNMRGPLHSVAKASYSVGDRVTFQCSINSKTSEVLICLTSGQWAIYSTECVDCPTGQAIFKDKCYDLIDKTIGKKSAVEFCEKLDGKVASAKTLEDNIFLELIREPGTRLWLGGDGAYNKGWTWDDGTSFKWMNWQAGGIIRNDLYNCLYMDFNTKWQSARCYHSLYFICETKKKVSKQTDDIVTSCPTLLPGKDMCRQYPHLANLCPHTCSD